jgi:hypothetical protein
MDCGWSAPILMRYAENNFLFLIGCGVFFIHVRNRCVHGRCDRIQHRIHVPTLVLRVCRLRTTAKCSMGFLQRAGVTVRLDIKIMIRISPIFIRV